MTQAPAVPSLVAEPRAEPLYFGPPGRPLFGWIHRPTEVRDLGLVIANPFGYEAICAHRSLRHFAEAAAGVGVPALRFDYDGTGDSAGDDRDPDRLRAWVASVGDAIDTLRRVTGVSRVCVLGVRLGALIVSLAAAPREDVAGLIAVAPVVVGKAYLRELRALQMALGLADPPLGAMPAEGVQEALGFVVSADTKAALTKVDLAREDRRPAPSVLLLDRSDMPSSDAWAARLAVLGAVVDARRVPGYVEMVLDPHKAVVPEEMIRATTAWLRERAQDGAVAASPAGGAPSASCEATMSAGWAEAASPAIRERAVFVDGPRGLFGIVSEPEAAVSGARKGILLLNAGSIHHVGPNRLYVALARRWAAVGHVVLRLDLAGIGDSRPLPGAAENVVYAPRASDHVRAATAYLRSQSRVAGCLALGLCSGGYHAFTSVVSGVALDRVILINPLTFRWKPGMSLDQPGRHAVIAEAERYGESVLSLAKWRKVLRGDVDLRNVATTMGRHAMGRVEELARDAARRLARPFPNDLGAELAAISARGVDLRFVFAAGDPGLSLLRGQGGSSVAELRDRGRLSIDLMDGPDHTFTPVWSHAPLVDLLSALVEGPSARSPAASSR